MRTLSLQDSNLDDFSFLREMNQLEDLFVDYTNFNNLVDLPVNLKELDLSGCSLSDEVPLRELDKLMRLTLTEATCKSLEFLYMMPNIKYLFIRGINKNISPLPINSLDLKEYTDPLGMESYPKKGEIIYKI